MPQVAQQHIQALMAEPDISGRKPSADLVDEFTSIDDGKKLNSAFQLFNEMSRQLADSYQLLENRVAELTRELNIVTAQRFQELAEKERLANRLESLLKVLPGGVVVIDAKGYIAECNPAAYEMLGEPLQGLLWREVIHRCFAPRRDDGHEVSTRDGRRISIATRSLQRNLGQEGNGEAQGWQEDGQIILLTDQTETRQLQAELSRHERLSALGRMVSALAHQIRTPLSAAMLYAGHLCNGQVSERQRQQFSEKLLKRLNHMERQVQDMLLFVKGELPLNDVINLNELQHSLAEAVEVPLSTSKARCEWRNDCGGRMIRCNREALIGALLNLINNAIQADDSNPNAKERAPRLSITFVPVEGGDSVALSVRDWGPGIDPQLMKTVRDLFVTTKAQGTGLGLAIVQTVARAHGGRFELRSQLQRGTRATLVLPVVKNRTHTDGHK